jgi:transposase
MVDEDLPGRPTKTDEMERGMLIDPLSDPPIEQDNDVTKWTPEATQDHIQVAFGIEYSRGPVRLLLHEFQWDYAH